MPSNEILDLSREFYSVTEEAKALEAQLKKVKFRLETLNGKLRDEMINEELQNFKTADGVLFMLRTTEHVNKVSEREEELLATLRYKGFEDLVKPTIHPGTLKSLVKEQLESEGGTLPEWLDGLVNVFTKTQVVTRKA